MLYNAFIDEEERNVTLMFFITISGCFGILISLSSLLMTTVCGPLALNVVGTLKDVLLTYAGFIIFGGIKATPQVILGLALSFIGASYLVYYKHQVKN